MQLKVTNNEQLANMYVYFGSRKELKLQNNIGGQGVITQYTDGWIDKAVIKVPIDSIQFSESSILSIAMEEITQCLGTVGDSYRYPLSVFYEKSNTVTQLTKIDERVIQLLYDPAMPAGYTCEQFERDFADQLYHINSEEKLLRYLQGHAVSKQALEHIIEYGLITSANLQGEQSRVIKFNQPIAVTVQGDTTARHISLLEQTLQRLNQTSDQLQLHLAYDSLLYDGGLHYHFRQVEKLESLGSSIEVKVTTQSTKKLLFHRRFTTDVYITYKDTTTLREKMPLAIANTLYQSVCLVHQPAPVFFTYENDSLQINPEYAEVLRTYYAPELANNMTKVQLESVLANMQ